MQNLDSLLKTGIAGGTGGNSNNLFLILLIVIPIGLVIFMIFKKKNGGGNTKNNKSGNQLKNKQQEDEVWLTIKRYLRDKEELGKEVVDSYVVKRPDPRAKTKAKKQADKEFKKLKTTNPEEYKIQKDLRKIENRKKPKELYVVLFTTKNTKTHVLDKPRAIECEVVYKKVNKNTNQRTILINQTLDYDKEMEWIQPIKAKDDKELARQLRVEQRRIQRKKLKEAKNKEKQATKSQKQENIDKKENNK